MEDWFSEDLLPEARRGRPVDLLGELERRLLRRASFASCPSQAMSQGLVEAYGCAAPAVIYNAFPWSDRAAMDGLSRDRQESKRPSIHWYSQTIGKRRGLEELLSALPLIRTEAELHLRGEPAAGFEAWLRERVPDGWRGRVYFHPLVRNEELLSRIAEHDIGFAGEVPYCRSKILTVSNKILHYLLAGIAVVASDTLGQREVQEQAPEAILLYPPGDFERLASRLNGLLESKEVLRRAKAAALTAASKTFCWERQEARLLDAVKGALLRVDGPRGEVLNVPEF